VGKAISAWQVRLGSGDLFIDDEVLTPLRAHTIAEKGVLLALFVCWLRELGVASSKMSLSQIFTARNLERVLEAVSSQRPQRVRYSVALAVRQFAANWIKLPSTEVVKMESICQRYRNRARGLSEDNHSRLIRHFYEFDAHRILDLPFIIADKANDLSAGIKPVDFATAAYLTILFYCPMPILEISRLQLNDLRRTRLGWVIEKQAQRVRSRYMISYEITGHASNLLAVYLKNYRPKLRGASSSVWLFPGRKNFLPVAHDSMRTKIKRLYEHVSADVDVRLLRWLIGCYYLEDNPKDLEGLKQLLGFNNTASVSELYDSFRRYHVFLEYHEKVGAHRLPQNH
jgi:site-specific recombinase XerD